MARVLDNRPSSARLAGRQLDDPRMTETDSSPGHEPIKPHTKRSMPALARDLGMRLTLRLARHSLDDHVFWTHPWYDTTDTCEDEAIFVGGCGRTGTTLVREILSRHSRIAGGPESDILSRLPNLRRLAEAWNLDAGEVRRLHEASSSMIDFAGRFYRSYANAQGKPRWSDKSPGNVRVVRRLLSRFPRARFIHTIRDGRDVVCSLRNHPSEKVVKGEVVPIKTVNPIDQCARLWLDDTSVGLPYRNHPRYMEVRYEALVQEPERVVRELCRFVGESFEPGMLQPGTDAGREAEPGRWLNNPNAQQTVVSKSVGRWKRDLSPEERRTFIRLAGELLMALGYAADHSWADE